MPPRTTPPPPGSWYPPNDASTYRDLVRFEERLKTTAETLQGRKFRYKVFLAQLLIVIAFLLVEVKLRSPFLSVPYKWMLQKMFPDIYTDDTVVVLHPYFASGLLFVSVTTLVLFFASGMYTDKIAYANHYVPHANRALRSLNMYLNVRRPPLRSKFRYNPLSFLFSRPPEPRSTSPHHITRAQSPPPQPPLHPGSSTESVPVPISPIPPTTNPRGELIFSSRVDKTFREAYIRHRAAFERRREDRERLEWSKTWIGWFWMKLPFTKKVSATAMAAAAASGPLVPMVGAGAARTMPMGMRSSVTPTGSRRSSPVPKRMQDARSACES